MLDLNAMAPQYHEVQIGAEIYKVPKTINDMPVLSASAALEIVGRIHGTEGNPEPKDLVELIVLFSGMPRTVAEGLTSQQLSAIFALVFPKVEGEADQANPSQE